MVMCCNDVVTHSVPSVVGNNMTRLSHAPSLVEKKVDDVAARRSARVTLTRP
jgi:hypothetical protein